MSGSDGSEATARIYVGSESRARELADQKAGATFRELPIEEIPTKARENLLAARATHS